MITDMIVISPNLFAAAQILWREGVCCELEMTESVVMMYTFINKNIKLYCNVNHMNNT